MRLPRGTGLSDARSPTRAVAADVPGKRTRVDAALQPATAAIRRSAGIAAGDGLDRSAPAAGRGARLEELFGAAVQPAPRTAGAEERARVAVGFPHAASIQAALGVAIPGAAVVDPERCAQRGVPAFTDGNVTAFASGTPALEVAAHEAAHQLQHAGVTNDAGLGAERHAHQIARAVATGGDPRELLGPRGDPVAPAVRDYQELDALGQLVTFGHAIGTPMRITDDLDIVTSAEPDERCFAAAERIVECNAVLENKQSAVRLVEDDSSKGGRLPKRLRVQRKELVRIAPKWLSVLASEHAGGARDGDDAPTGEKEVGRAAYYTDCGRLARAIQGPVDRDAGARGVYRHEGQTRETSVSTDRPALLRDELLATILGDEQGGEKELGGDALATYWAKDDRSRQEFDEQHALNRHAAPHIAEAFLSCRDDRVTRSGFNFHWGPVVMISGGDRVTLENYAREDTDYATMNARWYFAMYGPPSKPAQTWHDRWAEDPANRGVGAPGARTMTMTARTSDRDGPPAYRPGEALQHPLLDGVDVGLWATAVGFESAGPPPVLQTGDSAVEDSVGADGGGSDVPVALPPLIDDLPMAVPRLSGEKREREKSPPKATGADLKLPDPRNKRARGL